jgi:hypothetical protein
MALFTPLLPWPSLQAVLFFILDASTEYTLWTPIHHLNYTFFQAALATWIRFSVSESVDLQYYVVQPGPSFLSDVTTMYSSLSYNTSAFITYTDTGHSLPPPALSTKVRLYPTVCLPYQLCCVFRMKDSFCEDE